MNLMKMVTAAITPMIASRVAGALGVPEGMVKKAMSVGIPLILAALMKRGGTPGGTDAIGAAMRDMGSSPLDSLSKALGGDAAQITGQASSGMDMLNAILGDNATGALTGAMASHAGADKGTIGSLLGLAGMAAVGGVKSVADERNLDTAGVMKLLASEKDEILGALPPEIARMPALSSLLPDVSAPRAPAPQAPASSGGAMKWILGIAAVAILAWLAFQFLAPAPEPTTTAPATAADALVVDGVNVGDSLQGILDDLTGTLSGITDGASATAALEALTAAETSLGGLESAVTALPAEGKTALQALLAGAMPTLRTTIDGLLADTGIASILKPVLDSVMARLDAFAG